jgi:aryl-alcohol dehydrogenase-like predicted oxidoreductase
MADTDIEFAPFGRTGHLSSRVIFGGAALGAMSAERAYATLEVARAAGVNHLDTAHSYGRAEDVMRPWLAEHRNSVFLATKTGERSGDAARAGLEDSLRRMDVDRIDLIQLHNLVEPDEWEQAFAPAGAVAALAKARDEGLVGAIGVTGHGLRIIDMHRRSLERFDFDSVLFPLNAALFGIDSYRSSAEELMAICVERGVAVQTIKSIARGRWADDASGPRYSWYEPLRDPGAIERAVRFVLGRPGVFLNTTSDATLLPLVFEAAARTRVGDVPSAEEMSADAETFGVTPLFDGGVLERI